MDYILMLSYGKDSLSCLFAIKKLGLPLTRIIHSEVWATPSVPADYPEVVEFKYLVDLYIKFNFGITVEHYSATSVDGFRSSRVCYSDVFYHKRANGNIHGFPLLKGSWCQKLKVNISQYYSKNDIVYLGIACDEVKRIKSNSNIVYPLVIAGWNENFCYSLCKKHNLLNPSYQFSFRSGCWFCHKQPIAQLRYLKFNYPHLWNILLNWDKDSPFPFHCDGHTVADFDIRFSLEEQKLIDSLSSFRWSSLEKPLQYHFF